MYSKRKESDLRTPFCTFSSGTLYSFINAGRTVNGEQVSATEIGIIQSLQIMDIIGALESGNSVLDNLLVVVVSHWNSY